MGKWRITKNKKEKERERERERGNKGLSNQHNCEIVFNKAEPDPHQTRRGDISALH